MASDRPVEIFYHDDTTKSVDGAPITTTTTGNLRCDHQCDHQCDDFYHYYTTKSVDGSPITTTTSYNRRCYNVAPGVNRNQHFTKELPGDAKAVYCRDGGWKIHHYSRVSTLPRHQVTDEGVRALAAVPDGSRDADEGVRIEEVD
jgi:hypothetical protein